jgi:hypothetical protein
VRQPQVIPDEDHIVVYERVAAVDVADRAQDPPRARRLAAQSRSPVADDRATGVPGNSPR